MDVRPGCLLSLSLAMVLLPGCVERTLKIRTNPPGAQVVINDEEVGLSPVKFSFTWYGNYDIIVRKPGYATLKTTYEVKPPWWQIPPIDLIPEAFIAETIRDEHEPPVFVLQPAENPTNAELLDRAVQVEAQMKSGG